MRNCFEIAVNLHGLASDDREKAIREFQALAERFDLNPLLAWADVEEGCMHCRSVVEDLHCLPAYQVTRGGS